jgi:RNA polymerase sigma factor (sigma-70 family)
MTARPSLPPSSTSRRMTAAQERALALRMRAEEERALAIISEIPAARAILERHRSHRDSTRAWDLERLEEAVVALRDGEGGAAGARAAAAAGEALAKASALRWELALSARRVALGEARRFAGKLMSEDDLIHEGCIGLLKAAQRFEPGRGIRFATYARWWVRAELGRAIDVAGRPVHMSALAVEQARTVRRLREAMLAAGEDVSVATLASELGLSEDRIRLLLRAPRPVSLDAPTDPEGSVTLGESMADEDAVCPLEACLAQRELEALRARFAEALSPREQHVLVRRFGLDDREPGTLEVVGAEVGVSRERVRQLELRALSRLRAVSDRA